MRDRRALSIAFATLGGCVATAVMYGMRFPRWERELGPPLFAACIALAAFMIPRHDTRPRIVATRVVSCALGGGLLLGLATLGYGMLRAAWMGAIMAVISTPLAVLLTSSQRWAASARERSEIGGLERATLATAMLGVIAMCPWWVLDAHPEIGSILVGFVAFPAIAIALQTAIVVRRIHVLDEAFEHRVTANGHRGVALAFDLGVGDEERVVTTSAHPYRGPGRVARCRGSGDDACAMLRRVGGGAVAVAAVAMGQAMTLWW